MAQKTKKEKTLTLDRKSFDSLLDKREALVKEITRKKNRLAKLNTELAKFEQWFKDMVAPVS